MLLIRVDDPSPRAQYALKHLLGRMTGWSFAFAATEEEFRSSTLPKLRYGARADVNDPALVLHASGALESAGTVLKEPSVGLEAGIPILYPSSAGDDPVAGTFYLLSRCEELLATHHDVHGRLPSDAHFAVRHGFEQLPVIDHWMWRLVGALRTRFPDLPEPATTYRHVMTVDVDNGTMVLGRPGWKQAGAIVRGLVKGDLAEARTRVQALVGRSPDPFDRYDQLVQLARSGQVDRMIAFLLMRGEGAFDHASDHRHALMRKRVVEMDEAFEVGLHPSYASSVDHAIAQEDRKRLEDIVQRPVRIGRQHFLRWRYPDTLAYLNEQNFLEDHTLGFSDRPGFIAGTCTPFPWYDLEHERETDLMLWPFAVMDSALHDRMGMGPEDATRTMCAVSDAVREVKGTFVSVWHDRFLSGYGAWQRWPEALNTVVAHARS
jgi:hypothetical protein